MKEYPRILKNILEILCQKIPEHLENEHSYKFVYIGQYFVRFLVSILVSFQKVQNLSLSYESSNARKISLEGGNQDPGDPVVGKVRGGEDFFSFKQREN